jgi:PAS domain-containing protein
VSDWRYLAANPALCAMFGTGDLTGSTTRQRFPPAADSWCADFERVILGQVPEVLVRQGSQRPEICEVVLSSLRYGGHRAIMARIRDIASEQQAREQQRDAEARYKRLTVHDTGVLEFPLVDTGSGYLTKPADAASIKAALEHAGRSAS